MENNQLKENINKMIEMLSEEITKEMEKGIQIEPNINVKGVNSNKAIALAELIIARAIIDN